LAAEILTGRYSRDNDDKTIGGRFVASTGPGKLGQARYYHELYFDALLCLRPVSEKHGLSEVECALSWLKYHSQLMDELGDGIVIGSSSLKQLVETLDALQVSPLPDDVVNALNECWEFIRCKELIYWY
jgi:aflatoxin B1 aldehyde reductase